MKWRSVIRRATAIIAAGVMLLSGGIMTMEFTAIASESYNIAILKDERLDELCNVENDAQGLFDLYKDGGHSVSFINCYEFADAERFNASLYDILIISYGDLFPVNCVDALKKFVRDGGRLITLGGYAFSRIVDLDGGSSEESKALKLVNNEVGTSYYYYTLGSDDFSKGKNYTVSADIKAEDIKTSGGEDGIAYVSVYVYGAGKLLEFKDYGYFSSGSSDWRHAEYTFRIPDRADSIKLNLGFYRTSGTMWFDNLRFADSDGNEAVAFDFDDGVLPGGLTVGGGNADLSFDDGKPYGIDPLITLGTNTPSSVGDYLLYDSSCLPLFDPEHRYTSASRIAASEGQGVFAGEIAIDGNTDGYSAITIAGENRVRWESLISAYDESGSVVGTLGALAWISPDRGSSKDWNPTWNDYENNCIAFFGVTGCDIVKHGNEALREGMLRLVDTMMRGVYIRNGVNRYDCYKENEKPNVTFDIPNTSDTPCEGEAVVEFVNADTGVTEYSVVREFTALGKSTVKVIAGWKDAQFKSDFYFVRCTIGDGNGNIYDGYETGFAVWNDETVANGIKYTYHDNYIHILDSQGGETPIFAAGVDDGSNLFGMDANTPSELRNEMIERNDIGIRIYEVLNGFTYTSVRDERYMRKVDLLVYLAQKYDQIFMLGIAIGANIAVSEETVTDLQRVCGAIADRYKDVPGFIYYLNGDLTVKLLDTLDGDFNEYLSSAYDDSDSLNEAWKTSGLTLGSVKLDTTYGAMGEGWADVKAYDYSMFKAYKIKKWCGALIDAINEKDTSEKLILCEFYAYPYETVDIPAALGELGYSNIGFFNDYLSFPQTLAYSDMRYCGKSLGIGEFGKRTNELYADAAYENHRSTTDILAQKQFFTIYNNSLTMGANHLHLWCWSDEERYNFPWGCVFAYDNARRQLFYDFRNSNLFSKTLEPVYTEPEVAMLLANGTRLGGSKEYYCGHFSAVRALDILQRTNVGEVLTLNDSDLVIPESVKVIFYPMSYNPTDEVIDRLTEFVEGGGVLYLSGDISYDENRNRTKTDRLTALAGVKWEETYFDGTDYKNKGSLEYTDGTVKRTGSPNIKISLAGAQALYSAADGTSVVTLYELGEGKVVFSADPIEIYSNEETITKDSVLYSNVLGLAGVATLNADIGGYEATLKTFKQTMADGSELYSFMNCNSAKNKTVTATVKGTEYAFDVPSGQTYMLLVNGDGELSGAFISGTLTANFVELLNVEAESHIFTLDAKPLAKSSMVVVLPKGDTEFSFANTAITSPFVQSGYVSDGKYTALSGVDASLSGGVVSAAAEKNRIILISDKSNGEKTAKQAEILSTQRLYTPATEDAPLPPEEPEKTTLPWGYIAGAVGLVAAVTAVTVLAGKSRKKKSI